MGRLLSILIVIGGLVGAYFVYRDYSEKTKEKRNSAAIEISKLIEFQCRNDHPSNMEDAWLSSESNVFRILALVKQAEDNGYSPGVTLAAAASESSARPGEARMISDMLTENYRILKQLKVFDELGNILKMENGSAPTAKAAEWEGEKVMVGHMLSPLFAPEAACSLANLMVMPESARNMQMDNLAGFTPELSKKWLVERLITPESHELIVENLLDPKAKAAY